MNTPLFEALLHAHKEGLNALGRLVILLAMEEKTDMSIQEIADASWLTKAVAASSLNDLEKQGWVYSSHSSNSQGQRIKVFSLDSKASELIQDMRTKLENHKGFDPMYHDGDAGGFND